MPLRNRMRPAGIGMGTGRGFAFWMGSGRVGWVNFIPGCQDHGAGRGLWDGLVGGERPGEALVGDWVSWRAGLVASSR